MTSEAPGARTLAERTPAGARTPASEKAPEAGESRRCGAHARRSRLLFVCVENSCRSQMAEAFARRLGGEEVEAHSAGSRPSGRVHPRAVQFMEELGYDLSRQGSKSVDDVPPGSFDAVVSMGCGDACPHVPALRRLEWEIPDPKDLPDEEFRRVRDQIGERVKELLAELGR